MGIRELRKRLVEGETIRTDESRECETCGSRKHVYLIRHETKYPDRTISWIYRICRACVKALAK